MTWFTWPGHSKQERPEDALQRRHNKHEMRMKLVDISVAAAEHGCPQATRTNKISATCHLDRHHLIADAHQGTT
jgi:hypothetical protein